MSTKSRFNSMDYQEAKEYLKGAVVIRRFRDDVETNTLYRTSDGYLFYEHESRLRGREDEYCLEVMEEPRGVVQWGGH